MHYGMHSICRTNASLVYKRTKNIRTIQLPLGHTRLENAVRYLRIEVYDALEMLVKTEVNTRSAHSRMGASLCIRAVKLLTKII